MKFKTNEAGMRQLQRDLEAKFSGGLRVPADGSEEDAVRDVTAQLEALGATPNEAEVRRIVRENRS
jgi:hypothetical protein